MGLGGPTRILPHSHAKALAGMAKILGGWPEVSSFLSTWPHNITTLCFLPAQWSQGFLHDNYILREEAKATSPFKDWAQNWYNVTSATLYWAN